MGYLNNSTITVDAVLTKKGRELLARGYQFSIDQFALGDDEIDYDLWNPAHPLGTNYYGAIIENMPLVEASTDENNIMRFKLITLDKNTTNIPFIQVAQTSITLSSTYLFAPIIPSTAYMTDANTNLGYTAILSNIDVADLSVTKLAPGATSTIAGIPGLAGVSTQAGTIGVSSAAAGDAGTFNSIALSGLEFKITGKPSPVVDQTATITIIGNETGGSVTINLTVKKL